MKHFSYILAAWVAFTAYPALHQYGTWINGALDAWAMTRVASNDTASATVVNAQLASLTSVLPEHLRAPLPTVKP